MSYPSVSMPMLPRILYALTSTSRFNTILTTIYAGKLEIAHTDVLDHIKSTYMSYRRKNFVCQSAKNLLRE